MAVIEQYPFVDEEGKEHTDLVKHYSDEGKDIIQLETGGIYTEAVDKYPCKFRYEEVPDQPDQPEPVSEEVTDSLPEDEEQVEDADTSEQSGSSFAKNTLKALFDN